MENPSCDFHAASYVVLDAIFSDTRASPDFLQNFKKYTKEDTIQGDVSRYDVT
jgi:hypothetical protein